MESSFKKDRSKIRIISDINMQLMLENGIRGGICHAIHHMPKLMMNT